MIEFYNKKLNIRDLKNSKKNYPVKITVEQIYNMEPIIIIGMHRAGTSLLTQILQQSGVFHNLI